MTTAELLGNAALGVLALVVIWGLLQTLGVDIVNWMRGQLLVTGAARPDERGFTTIQYVIAVAWSLVLLVLVANLLVDLYARGAVRDALDDGVRAGAPAAARSPRARRVRKKW